MGAQDLVERADELAALTSALRSAREGRGGVLAIEAAAGHGKTRLLRELRASAETDGFRVLTAVGAPLERDFANGVVRQLLEGEVHSAADERAQRLFAGAAGLAAPVFSVSEGALAAGDVTHARLHGLYWLTANLAEERPLVLIVDDAHWSDAASLRFLDVLSRRVGDLPILVAVGMRPAEPGAESQLLDGLLVAADSTLLRPAALSREGVRALLNAGAEPAFVAACMQSTGGNPLLVTELARSLADAGLTGRADEADAAQRLVPGTVVRSVLARLRGLGPEAVDFARSLAVLGDRSSIERVGRLAGLARGDAGAAHPVLVRAGLIAGEELRFVHPMVRDAVAADLIGDERGRLHAQAARMLADDGVSDTEVAIHLMHAPAQAAGWAARSLLASARQALDAGAPEVAVRQLTRAVAEPPDAADVPDVLLALGLAQTRAGDSAAAATLESAAAAGDSAVAAAAALVRANLLVLRGRPDDALGALRAAAALTPPGANDALEDTLLEALPYDDAHLEEYERRLTSGPLPARPAVLAHLALLRAKTGADRETVVDLARRALADGELVRLVGPERLTCFFALEALHLCEAADDADAALRDLAAAARASGSRSAAALLTVMRSHWERAFGDLRRAEDEARRGLALFESMRSPGGVVLSSVALGSALLDRGDVEGAHALTRLPVSDERGYSWVCLLGLRARVALERGEAARALSELDAQAAVTRRRDWIVTEREPPAILRIATLTALDRSTEALELADREIETARRRRLHGAEAAATLARARIRDRRDAVGEFTAAVDTARQAPSRLLLANALTGLGGALRRAGQRPRARDTLREALALAHACGADRLGEQAREELVVAGARPHRIPHDGRDTLTASERRVADLAADGNSNKEIAQALFVTVKTVEVHLGRAYAKLDIAGRRQLAGALRRAG